MRTPRWASIVTAAFVYGSAAHAAEHAGLALIHFERAPGAQLQSGLVRQLSARPVDGMEWRAFVRDGFHSDWPGSLVVVEIRGSCEIPAYDTAWRPEPLGWINRVGGEFTPFVYADCSRIAETLHRATHDPARWQAAMTQALAAVIRHELTHWIRQSAEHGTEGEFRPALSAENLMAVAR